MLLFDLLNVLVGFVFVVLLSDEIGLLFCSLSVFVSGLGNCFNNNILFDVFFNKEMIEVV